MSRITTSGATPDCTDRDRARFRVLVEPEMRIRSWADLVPDTLGDVLDMAPARCASRTASFSRTTGRLWVRPPEPCDSWSCPTCVVTKLMRRVAPAWAYWRGSADVEATGRIDRHALKVRFRGADATPGALSIPHGNGRAIFMPGRSLTGEALDAELVRVLRAVPLDFRMPREVDLERPRAFWGVPDWRTAADMLAIAGEMGLSAVRHPNSRILIEGLTQETATAFADALWDRAYPHGQQLDAGYLQRVVAAVQAEPEQVVEAGQQRVVVSTNLVNITSTSSANHPTCRLCDSPAWHGWFHERWAWLRFPWCREAMLRTHYPYQCGYVSIGEAMAGGGRAR